jgi:site-specific recombinase XerD
MNKDAISEKFVKFLEIKNYSKNTIGCYKSYLNLFLNYYHDISPTNLNQKHLEDFIYNYKFTSISQQNQIYNSLKLFYTNILKSKLSKINLERPRKEKHLPQIIDKQFLITQIEKIQNLKHKSIISLSYSVGLRVSEVINLKIEDIDSKRMIIHIKNAKGRKDRIVPLSQNILELLRKYWVEFKPKEYLFNGQHKSQYSSNSCNKIVKEYLGKDYHFHTLRHSCFTHLIENGTDCRIIQKLAGHNNIKTTEIYTQISTDVLKNIKLPI